MSLQVRRAITRHSGEAGAEELLAGLDPDAALAVVYATPGPDADALAARLHRAYPGRLIGCLADGLIGPGGYLDGGATAASISSPDVQVHVDHLELGDIAVEARLLATRLEPAGSPTPEDRSVGILLVDGLSLGEECLTENLQHAMPWLEVVGGSASGLVPDGGTGVLVEGAFRSGVATLAVVHTTLPIAVVKIQHHVAGERRLVITEADPTRRRVHEIDGYPAATAYAKALGCDVDDLDDAVFAEHPLIARLGGVEFLRSIKARNDDGSLDMFCQLSSGTVLRVGEPADPVRRLAQSLRSYGSGLAGTPGFLAFDCVLRRLEFDRSGIVDDVGDLLDSFTSVGFSTFGEQCQGLHMNQTLTGLMIGDAA